MMKKTWYVPTHLIEIFPYLLSFSLASLYIYLSQIRQDAPMLILGVIAGALVNIDHRTSGRMKNLAVILICFSISVLMVQFSRTHSMALSGVMMCIAFFSTMLGVIDSRYRTIAFGTFVVAIYTLLNPYSDDWLKILSLMIGGTLIYQLSQLICYWLFPNRSVENHLNDAFYRLGAYFQVKADFFNPDFIDEIKYLQYQLALATQSIAQAFSDCHDSLFKRIGSHDKISQKQQIQLNSFFIAQDLYERITASHVQYKVINQELKHSDIIFRLHNLIHLQGNACHHYGKTAQNDLKRLDRAYQQLGEAWAFYQRNHNVKEKKSIDRLIANLGTINELLRHLFHQQYGEINLVKEKRILTQKEHYSLRYIIKTLRNHLTPQSSYFRHAVRLTLITFLCCLISECLHLQTGYWILLTAVFVCQPNYSATKRRLMTRIIGTMIGVVLGSLIPYFSPNLIALLTIIIVSNTLFFYFRTRNYGFATCFITVQVFANFYLANIDMPSYLLPRLFDTLIGAGITWLCVATIWPDWNYLGVKNSVLKAMDRNIHYFRSIIQELKEPNKHHYLYLIHRSQAYEMAANLASVADEVQNNLDKYQSISEDIFNLTQLNYRLLSVFSALASFRGKLAQARIHSLSRFFQLAREIDSLQTQLIEDDQAFYQHLSSIYQTINACDTHQESLLHDLKRILKLLSKINDKLQHIQD